MIPGSCQPPSGASNPTTVESRQWSETSEAFDQDLHRVRHLSQGDPPWVLSVLVPPNTPWWCLPAYTFCHPSTG